MRLGPLWRLSATPKELMLLGMGTTTWAMTRAISETRTRHGPPQKRLVLECWTKPTIYTVKRIMMHTPASSQLRLADPFQ